MGKSWNYDGFCLISRSTKKKICKHIGKNNGDSCLECNIWEFYKYKNYNPDYF